MNPNNPCERCHSNIQKAMCDLYLVESALEGALEVFPSTHSWHLQQILSDLYSGIRYLEEIVGDKR